ncbi:pyrroloquinoline quinone biosynthesis protein PqqF [Pseudomonas huanghezhanensis]|uniref:pyrroloquinoline quinone biosynthesis protein PqqF n=1 Tax=Pseudomonas huanghezhanensis TaxID=3002903 RepID=UPI0022866A61|nr:pyrroloquinoline quinone biosynthesis protein PqqF [Pseudomonas sp. BSw22131]
MPAPASLTTQRLILPNGLHVSLCHAPRLKRCAAALRVAAGSHDAPREWPGLAHFLEHLFFLGTERFPAGQNLMAFVQRHGGQLNASTRERTTDFFFELPEPVFAHGLERLCEMLVHPRMAMEDQLREREVLHAEFIAWSRDAASRDQRKLLGYVSAAHPLSWFHAGNRYSLLVPHTRFQKGLRDFYQRFYQAGQMKLSLVGPQPLYELKALAERLGGLFPAGEPVEQIAPAALISEASNPIVVSDSSRMHLLFLCDDLPDGAEEAVGFFCFWLGNLQPGGLISELKTRGLAESLKAEVLYQFREQALINIEIVPVAGVTPEQEQEQILALLLDWLHFFKTHFFNAHCPSLRNEYALFKRKQLDAAPALMLARHYSEHASCDVGLSDNGALALEALIDDLAPTPASTCNAEWRLPQPNPFLQPAQHSTDIGEALPSLTFSSALPDTTGEGAVYLRWTLVEAQPALWQMLNDSLESLTDDAQQAGVNLAFTAYGPHWQLRVSGLTDVMPAVVDQALERLSHPGDGALARYGELPNAPRLIPIRQLLKTLPDHLSGPRQSSASGPVFKADGPDVRSHLQAVWENASWNGLAMGLSSESRNDLLNVLRAAPGLPDQSPLQPPRPLAETRWQIEPSESSEDAVLLFCAAPSDSPADQAAWRFIAHWLQTPFYQRLRVELQLGYAVFSGFRQIAGQSGIVFGVQSPSVSAQMLVGHIKQFIEGLPHLLASTDITAERRLLIDQLDFSAMETPQAAELLWQAHLAGGDATAFETMKHYFANFSETDLAAAFEQLSGVGSRWLYLSNRCNSE